MTAPDLSVIHRDIGKLLQSQENAENQRKTLFEKSDRTLERLEAFARELVQLRNDHNLLNSKVNDELAPHISEFKKLKQRGIGILTGIGLASSATGAALMKFFGQVPPHGGGD